MATVLYVLTQHNQVEVWDLRQKQEKTGFIQVGAGARGIRMHEGVQNVCGVYFEDGTVESFELTNK